MSRLPEKKVDPVTRRSENPDVVDPLPRTKFKQIGLFVWLTNAYHVSREDYATFHEKKNHRSLMIWPRLNFGFEGTYGFLKRHYDG